MIEHMETLLIVLLVWSVLATIVASVASVLLVYSKKLADQERERWIEQREDDRLSYRAQVVALGNIMQYGTAVPKEAIVSEAEPDAELRAQRRVDAETLQRGIEAMKQEYANKGMHVSDEEIRDEVESMMLGIAPRPQDVRGVLLVRD
jgi:hypothetical protein